MKACVLHGVGDLRFEETATPMPEADDVLIRVRACGVCGSDIPRIFTKGTYIFPIIPGHEFSGEIIRVGPNANPDLMGKVVTVFPLIPCRHCPACLVGAFAQCQNYSYLGSRCDGAFADYVRAPDWNVVRIPEGVSFEEAAMVEPAAVAAHALRLGAVDLGDTLVIFGAGPIGLMVALWARTWGTPKILLVDIDARKVAFAKGLGFEDVFDAQAGGVNEWVLDLTGGGADLVIEASGSSAAFEQGVMAARPFGRVVLLGNPAGEMKLSQEAYGAILRNELKVCGSWNSCYRVMPGNEWQLVLEFMASGRLDLKPLITHRVTLENLRDALLMMRDNTEFYVKVMYVR